ncbi:DUF979 domain-containing protein [Carnobacteriaceae bacterium zg-84]|uniref:DUF979 domain-containing protein n=1 Tax=Granulicatella sp. zg-84 TaxID=2678503 RepID=UPI0013C01210|nr:DUF979 domain-containing protein [Granulicatella sp. zg-84]NEW66774.1 DUF979 family protein [Granulicatella sp. zg-84]QMI85356.1 DUF979 domain-containing protein [Carnobacteriaceae bacterium zg-84]
MKNIFLELAYILIGFLFFLNAIQTFRHNKEKQIGTSLFWAILGFTFVFGNSVPYIVTGGLLIILGVLTATKQVSVGKFKAVEDSVKKQRSDKYGILVFLPSVLLAFVAFFVAFTTNLGGQVGVVIGSIVAFLVSLLLFKPSLSEVHEGTSQLTQQMGVNIFLPQLLAALGSIFATANVGMIISNGVASVVPANNRLIGVIAYVLGMVIFTIIMGNAFAAFTVITAGIGVPFVFALGGNPVLIGTMAMTAGYCGTLLTPMAANFNSMPASLLDMKNQYGIIKAQAPIALAMIVVHIVLMYTLGF